MREAGPRHSSQLMGDCRNQTCTDDEEMPSDHVQDGIETVLLTFTLKSDPPYQTIAFYPSAHPTRSRTPVAKSSDCGKAR